MRQDQRCKAQNISFVFFNDTATTEIYTLSLHDALPILARAWREMREETLAAGSTKSIRGSVEILDGGGKAQDLADLTRDRKSTRLNSSYANISYAVFCLKKKNRSNTP